MLKFITQRILFIITVSFFIVFITTLGMGMARNSDAKVPNFDMVHKGKAAWRETTLYLNQAVKGDFGLMQADGGIVSVGDVLQEAYRNSMALLLIALAAATVLGIYFGKVAAITRRSSLPLYFLSVTTIGISAPSFFVALMLQHGVIRYTISRGSRFLSVSGFGWDIDHMLLPILVLSARPLAYITRAAFLAFKNVMDQDFIRTANAKGLRNWQTVWVHGLKNAAVPILTAVGVSLRFSLSALPVVELFFNWPGVGTQLLTAINNRDTAVVVTLALALGLTFQLINLLLDISYRLIDPRLRQGQG